MSGKPGCGATKRSAEEQKRTYDAIMQALENHGEITAREIVIHTGLSRSTVKMALERLRKVGLIKMLGKSPERTRTGIKPRLYGLGNENEEGEEGVSLPIEEDEDTDSPFRRAPTVVIIHRHPQDVALFGEYERRAA
jgi:DNA-binding transcriptional ArsR family regulator